MLAVNLELCTLHLHETDNLEEILSFLLFADGCAAALVSADPAGAEIISFNAALVPDTTRADPLAYRPAGLRHGAVGRVPGAIRTL